MTCQELEELLPDLVDGTLPLEVVAEAEAKLPECPDCQEKLLIARQVRELMVKLQAETKDLSVPSGFEMRLFTAISRQSGGIDLLVLFSKGFGSWLIELVNLLGGLLDPNSQQLKPVNIFS